MSAALFNMYADPQKAHALSAGTNPLEQVHPEVVLVMHELGVDLTDVRPQKLTREMAKDANLLVTMGCGDQCPLVPGLRRQDWPLPELKGKNIAYSDDLRRKFWKFRKRKQKVCESWRQGFG